MIGISTKYIVNGHSETVVVLTEFNPRHYEYYFERKGNFKVFSKTYKVSFPRLARKIKFVSTWQGKILLGRLRKFEKSLDK